MQLKPRTDLMSEQEYRSLKDRLSYSSIKLFDEDRKKFYKEFILGEPSKDKETVSKIMGSLVHCYLAEQSFYDKFHMLSAVEPKGQMMLLVDNLYERAMKSVSINDEGERVLTENFETIFMDAVQATKYDHDMKEINFKGKDMQKILALFVDSDAEIYYKEKLDAIGKMVVSVSTITKAEQIVEKLRGHSYTHEIANCRTGGKLKVFHELAILYSIAGVEYKSLVDKLIIDDEVKTIQPIDWKTSWDNEEPDRAYLKFGYYLQGAMYDLAVKYWAKENGYADYTILPMKFIFCDTSGWADPVVLTLTTDDIERSVRGFKIRGYRYRGLQELMQDIAWHQESGNWATSKAIFDRGGDMKLNLAYGSK